MVMVLMESSGRSMYIPSQTERVGELMKRLRASKQVFVDALS